MLDTLSSFDVTGDWGVLASQKAPQGNLSDRVLQRAEGSGRIVVSGSEKGTRITDVFQRSPIRIMTALRTSLAGTATIGIALWGLIGGAAAAAVDGFELAPPCLLSADGLAKEGERWWTRSPDPGNPVACATCHYDAVAVSAWAPSFPKWKPLPPPHSRVMTLLQANAEAVARHYGLDDPRPAAVAITAYLMWLARGALVTPGTSAGQPVLPARLEALSASVERGHRAFQAGCRACHQVEEIAARALAFPRVTRGRAVSFEEFLEEHVSSGYALTWDGAPMADLLAYLMSRLAGRTLPVTRANSLEVSR